jgi:DNA-binding PadR family transcriptional regulator
VHILAGYNERKHEILELIEVGYETSKEIAEACGISHSCASTLLSRYWKFGLLRRYTGELYNEKIYEITERGYERLNYLRETILERMEKERITNFLANIKRCRVIKQIRKTNTPRAR